MEEQSKKIQVDTTEIKKGELKFFGKISNPTPTILARCNSAIRYTSTGMIALVTSSTLFTAHQATVICFWLSALILLTGGIDMIVGVIPPKKEEK